MVNDRPASPYAYSRQGAIDIGNYFSLRFQGSKSAIFLAL